MQSKVEKLDGKELLRHCDMLFTCDALEMKRASLASREELFLGENNFGKYAMRLCDFMVDYIGKWELVVCNSNCIDVTLPEGQTALAREVMLVFRYKTSGRDMFVTDSQALALGRAPLEPPSYWCDACLHGTCTQEVLPASSEELVWLQNIMDCTYKKMATRDRKGQQIASRFEVVQAVRSENPMLWDRYSSRRQAVSENL